MHQSQKQHGALRKDSVEIDWTDTDHPLICFKDTAALSLRNVCKGAVVEANQLLRPQRRHGRGAPLIIAKLDLGDGGGEHFNNCSYLTTHETVLG